MKYGIRADNLYLENVILQDGLVIIDDDRIEKVVCYNEIEILDSKLEKVYNLSNKKILPGIIDTHIHGGDGYDTMNGNFEALNGISKYLVSRGITAFLPTVVTDHMEKIKIALKNVKDSMGKVQGAEIIGSYLEGPFISKEFKGSHAENLIRKISIEDFKELIYMSENTIKIVVLSPEKKGAEEFIKFCKEKGIIVALGHSNATYEETIKAIENGAKVGVHTFNGMRSIHHREPGIVGAILTCDKVYSEIICDFIHQHPTTIDISLRCKPKDKIVLISDSIEAAGLKDGEYKLGASKVNVKDSIARIDNGALAGSTIDILKSIKIMIEKLNVDCLDAVNMASINPSRELGIDKWVGSIEQGKKANLTIVDMEYNPYMTIVNGKVVWKR
ncbi:N-acetylglucosamine-6-phosphate deacetylase [Clostridium tetani]|uniref:N-acetylglucosamine-6-phosphate deacetylase n=1 Tax=Clostridium tetani TaxID=1513 RepID=A0ABY0ETR1_CLOTA|nr:N-acetylglucosamine-6-phosphate deacetylase [Clostridium tetani]KHO40081.1 hypothetical protein OR62_02385 [Clostridium tetani]RXI57549.1 N-acetylglucosamine-6-phosphate deacetylase [Clostridium tetani]RXI72268.1 N-acetylglucosamine-6-phosphate deacetylase [Clostridium tetani]CDI48562.1 N-acetylglucosamine-6-phosphate deacetylase [Clostridium tetani 12124569]